MFVYRKKVSKTQKSIVEKKIISKKGVSGKNRKIKV